MKISKWKWVAGIIILLWLSPLIWALAKPAFFPEKEDQWKNWVAWDKERRRQERLELLAFKRSITPYKAPYQPQKSEGREVEVVYVDRPVVVERVVEVESSSPRQPDLSGFYTTIPMTGPNAGEVQINSVIGPS